MVAVAGLEACFCPAHPTGHPLKDHGPDVGFYCGVPGTCLLCGEMAGELPGWKAPQGPHVHAYWKPRFVLPKEEEVAASDEEEEE